MKTLENLTKADLAVIGNTWANDHTNINAYGVEQWLASSMANLGYEPTDLNGFIDSMKLVMSWSFNPDMGIGQELCECVGGTFGASTDGRLGLTFNCDWCKDYALQASNSLLLDEDVN